MCSSKEPCAPIRCLLLLHTFQELDSGSLLAKRFQLEPKYFVPSLLYQLCASPTSTRDSLVLVLIILIPHSASSEDACDKCFDNANLIDHSKPPVSLRNCASCKMVKYCSKASTISHEDLGNPKTNFWQELSTSCVEKLP